MRTVTWTRVGSGFSPNTTASAVPAASRTRRMVANMVWLQEIAGGSNPRGGHLASLYTRHPYARITGALQFPESSSPPEAGGEDDVEADQCQPLNPARFAVVDDHCAQDR